MTDGSRDHPTMLATERYAQWQSSQPAKDDSLIVPECIAVETLLNISPENKSHYDLKNEAIHLLLTGIGDEIYSTVDACKTAHEMWIATEKLQHGKSFNIQDVKTNLFWEFERFTSHDGESLQSYYSRSHATTRHKSKELAKPITPPSESAPKEESDPEQAHRDKDMHRNLALIAKRVTVAGARETVGSQERMLLCKQAKKGVPLQAEQDDWLEDMDEDIDKQELDEHYSYMEKIHEVSTVDSGTDTEPLEKRVNQDDSNVIPDSSNVCDNDNQDDQNVKNVMMSVLCLPN
uniref:Uncharacterized protein n=1 Tax=Tanacetum cinerariifolium TaxID=118510 RepID=A0A6L2KUA4_TANCI|nr:hypothetical protein [Tanacetum cinerariifolium]